MNVCLCDATRGGSPTCRAVEVDPVSGALTCGRNGDVRCAVMVASPPGTEADAVDAPLLVRTLRSRGWTVRPPRRAAKARS